MSTFRPPQVPQQPLVFFPGGQPLGIPIPRTDYQLQQGTAYWRERPSLEAFEQATGLVARVATSSGAAAVVPALRAPMMMGSPRPSLEAVEQITSLVLTAAQPLGTPNPRTEYQMAAYFPPRPIAIEVLSQQLEDAYTPGLSLGMPQQADQTCAYRRERPSLEALEQAVQITDAPATIGTALGTPNPTQSDQSAALRRGRIEIQQPPVFTVPSPVQAFVPAPVSPMPLTVSWRFEWIVDLLAPNFTPAQPLGTPNPVQADQSAAYRRERGSIEALQQALIRNSIQPPIALFVPALVVQVIAPNQWRFEWLIDLLAVNITPGQPLGVPAPKQSEQTASYWRTRVEAQAPQVFVTQQGSPPFVPSVVWPIPGAISARFEPFAAATQKSTLQSVAFVPALPIQISNSASQRFEPLGIAIRPFKTGGQAIAPFTPSTRLPMPAPASWRYEWLINALQPRGVYGPTFLIGSLRYLIRRLRARRFRISTTGGDFTVSRSRARRYTVSNADYLNFEPLYAGEKMPLTFDMTADLTSDELPPGVTLLGTPSITVIVISGVDANPTAILNGSAGLDVTQRKVIVPVQPLIGGVTYQIRVQCGTTQANFSPIIPGTLPVIK